MFARIYRPTKTAMQSGKAKTGNWILEFEADTPSKIDPLMGYTVSSDMKSQVRLKFKSVDAARAYAEKQGLAYRIEQPQNQKRRIMTYSDNFRYDRSFPWTH